LRRQRGSRLCPHHALKLAESNGQSVSAISGISPKSARRVAFRRSKRRSQHRDWYNAIDARRFPTGSSDTRRLVWPGDRNHRREMPNRTEPNSRTLHFSGTNTVLCYVTNHPISAHHMMRVIEPGLEILFSDISNSPGPAISEARTSNRGNPARRTVPANPEKLAVPLPPRRGARNKGAASKFQLQGIR
jgi:hypothetical protein